MEEIGMFVKRGETAVYAEDAFNAIADTIDLEPAYYKDEFCMEIDTNEDLAIAIDHFRKSGK